MKKKMYEKPTTEIVETEVLSQILQGSPCSMETTGRRNQLEDGTESLDW